MLVGHWGQKVVKCVFIIKVLMGHCCVHGIPIAFGMYQSTINQEFQALGMDSKFGNITPNNWLGIGIKKQLKVCL